MKVYIELDIYILNFSCMGFEWNCLQKVGVIMWVIILIFINLYIYIMKYINGYNLEG